MVLHYSEGSGLLYGLLLVLVLLLNKQVVAAARNAFYQLQLVQLQPFLEWRVLAIITPALVI